MTRKKFTDEFRKEAVQLALTSGLTRDQVAEDLGVGKSTLGKWMTAHHLRFLHRAESMTIRKDWELLRIITLDWQS